MEQNIAREKFVWIKLFWFFQLYVAFFKKFWYNQFSLISAMRSDYSCTFSFEFTYCFFYLLILEINKIILLIF